MAERWASLYICGTISPPTSTVKRSNHQDHDHGVVTAVTGDKLKVGLEKKGGSTGTYLAKPMKSSWLVLM